MAISINQRVDYLFKKIGYGVAKTDTNDNKFAPNESIPSPLLNRGDTLWAQSGDIPQVIPVSSSSVVQIYSASDVVECSEDITASANRTWKTNLADWIPPEFGATYLVSVYVHTSGDAENAVSSGTRLFVTGSGNDDEWFFDYQAGVLNFIGDNYPTGVDFSGKSVYIAGARYVGQKGVGAISGEDANLGNLTITDTTITTQNSGDDIVLQPTSNGVVDINTNTALIVPIGTTSQVPVTSTEGMIRYNTDTDQLEFYNGVDWIGTASSAGSVTTQAFTGDGSTVSFTLSTSADTATVLVTLNGVAQEPNVAYVVSGTTLTFSEAPVSTDRIEVRQLAIMSSVRGVTDSDGDTKISVESSPDNDVVIITSAGTDILSISSSAITTDNNYIPSNNYDLTTKIYVDTEISNISLDLSAVDQHILPDTDETYDLGSSTYKWRDLYLSGNTITLGSAIISSNSTEVLLPAGSKIGDISTNIASTTYVDQAEADAISSANAYTDTRETAITTAYQSYADQAETDAKSYTDSEISTLDTTLRSYADTAESDAKSYTDSEISTLDTTLRSYADQAETDAKSYTDSEISTLDTTLRSYADTAELDAISSANAYTDTAVANLIDSAPGALDTLNELAAALGDDASFSSTVNTALTNRLSNSATVTLTGDVTGTASFSGNTASITATIADDSHNHTIANVDGLQTALNGKLASGANAVSASKLVTARNINGVSFDGTANITVEPYVERDDTTNANRYITFVDDATAAHKRLNMDTNLIYNPSTNTIGTNISGNASSATSATSATSSLTTEEVEVYDGDARNAWHYPLFTNETASTGGTGVPADRTVFEYNFFKFHPLNGDLYIPGEFQGTATSAQYADLAEMYAADAEYEPGTVVIFGGTAEVTQCFRFADRAVVGVVSTNPAYLMNSKLQNGTPIALTGRVPVKVVGEVRPGDLLVTSSILGYATVNNAPDPGTILGKAITENSHGPGVVEALIILG